MLEDGRNSQTVAMGCPGGKKGKALASTTRSPFTPITLAFESTTAFLSSFRPMAQVHEAWKTEPTDFLISWSRSASEETCCSTLAACICKKDTRHKSQITYLRTREIFLANQGWGDGLRSENFAHTFVTSQSDFLIYRAGQPSGINDGRIACVGTADAD